MKIKTLRTHYDNDEEHESLETLLNKIGYENVLSILPTYYGGGEVAYTVIARSDEEWAMKNS